MNSICRFVFLSAILAVSLINLPSCNKEDEEVRMPDNILGIWSPDDANFYEFSDDYTVHHLIIDEQDGESIGRWESDVFFYEPGYNILIYLDAHQQANVYEIVELTSEVLTWCWVDEINVSDREESLGKIIGEIIKKAQEGYKLDPELFKSFRKVTEEEFFSVIESLDLMYPWAPFPPM